MIATHLFNKISFTLATFATASLFLCSCSDSQAEKDYVLEPLEPETAADSTADSTADTSSFSLDSIHSIKGFVNRGQMYVGNEIVLPVDPASLSADGRRAAFSAGDISVPDGSFRRSLRRRPQGNRHRSERPDAHAGKATHLLPRQGNIVRFRHGRLAIRNRRPVDARHPGRSIQPDESGDKTERQQLPLGRNRSCRRILIQQGFRFGTRQRHAERFDNGSLLELRQPHKP